MDDSLKIYTKKTCVEDFIRVRNTTLKLTQNLSAEDMVIQTNDFVSFYHCLLMAYHVAFQCSFRNGTFSSYLFVSIVILITK